MTRRSTRFVILFTLGVFLTIPLTASSTQNMKPDKNGLIHAEVTSSPPGAEVTYTAFGKSRTIGKTPFKWSFLLSDLTRSSMIPTLTFALDGHRTETMPLSSDKKVHVTLKAKKSK